jgi:hypothetical protein
VGLRKKNTLLHVYTHDQLISIQGHLMIRGGVTDLRLKLDLLMGHFMLLRSDNRLSAELADLFMIPQAREGVSGDVPMLFLLLRHSKVRLDLFRENIKIRRKRWESWSTVMSFVIKTYVNVQSVLWHFIYSFAFTLVMSHGLILRIFLDGKKSNCSVVEITLQRSCHTLHKISRSKQLSLITISISKAGHILDGKQGVSWVKHLTYQMHKFDD